MKTQPLRRLPPPNVAPPPAERPRHTPAPPGRRTRRRLRWGRRASLPLAAWLALTAWADPAPGVQRLALNPNAVVAVPVATDRLTTVRFPGPIAGLEAAFIATQPHPEARFLLSFQPGQPFFSLQAARPHATATLNVLWNQHTYVLELTESDEPWLSLVFEAPVASTARARAQAPSSSRLLGLLDTARAYPLLRQQHPAMIAGVQRVQPDALQDHGDYAIWIDEVFRFDAEDTLVFHLTLVNQTARPIRYLPQSLMVSVGDRTYFHSLTDATGLIPPHAHTPVYLAITRSPDGSRNNLSPRNTFTILLSRLPPEPPPSPPPAGEAPPLPRPAPEPPCAP